MPARFPRHVPPCLLAILLASSQLGCDSLDPVASRRSLAPGNLQSSVSRDGSMETDKVSLVTGDEAVLKEWIDQARGRVVLVDYWATWCLPCMEQFPHTVSLHEKHQPKGLEVLTISMDESNQADTVLSFLKRQNASCRNLLTPYGAGSAFADAFQIRGEVPFYQLYDRKGSLRYTFSGTPEGLENAESIERLDERILELLSEKP